MDASSSSSSSSSSSPASQSQTNYEVFLSFRGPDTRYTIISHLYHALFQKGVHTFHDRKALKSGDPREKLFQAIEGSRIAIIVFSQNYARSKWCLDELAKIMELQQKDKLKALPIFYQVSPREVRLHEKDNGEKGCYQRAMEENEKKYGADSETVNRWKEALRLGGNLIGIELGKGQDENAVIQDTLRTVLKILNRVPLEVAMHPVGIERQVKKIKKLLHINPYANDVYMIGLHGPGGVGKTTLSKAVCNDIAGDFDSWCFLSEIRERTSGVGLEKLQLKLLRDLLSEEGLVVPSVHEGKRLIQERLCHKRVLVVLDDVDDWNQFDALAGNLNWFGAGSRIIITTRDNHILSVDRVRHIYHVKLLTEKESVNLFRLHAFGKRKRKQDINRDLVDSFVKYGGKLPLALAVLGRYLHDRGVNEWKGKFKELTDCPDSAINSVLKVSFHGLQDQHKEIFLDVVCFFKGWNVGDVEKILDSCGFVTSLGLKILIERCLVTIVDGKIEMHDLLKEMGQSIIREDYLKGDGIPSRIWLYDDFLEILSEDSGRQQVVKGIVLNLSEEKVVDIKPSAFLGFKNLRVLIIRNVTGLIERLWLPRKIRWFEWRGCPASAIEFESSRKLVGLDLECSQVQHIKGTGFEELKYMSLSMCKSLSMLPDLSKSTKLEYLNLHLCNNLTSLDEAIGNIETLIHLDISHCYKLTTVPSSLRSKHFRTLKIHNCNCLCKLPVVKKKLYFLENLDLTGTAIKELPDSFGNLVALKELVIMGCMQLTTIPSNIYNLRDLERLYLRECKKLSLFPRNALGEATDNPGFPNLVSLHISNCMLKDAEFLNDLACFYPLKNLDLSGNEFNRVPACISKFNNLEYLWLRDCNQLVEVSELPNVPDLFVSGCTMLKNFPGLHTFICQTKRWYHLDLSNCISLDRGYIIRSLPLEKVRQFVGEGTITFAGEEFPKWLNFQSMDCDSIYRVLLSWRMSADDILGMAVFVKFNCVEHHRVSVKVGTNELFADSGGVGVHTLFLYVRPLTVSEYTGHMNWFNFLLKFSGKRSGLKSWGMRLLCKHERDDSQIYIQKKDQEGVWIDAHK